MFSFWIAVIFGPLGMVQFCPPTCDAAPEAEMHRLADGAKKTTSEFAYRAELIMASLNGLNVFFR